MILHFLIHSQGTEKQFATYVLQQFSAPDYMSEFVVMSIDQGITDYDAFHGVKIINPTNEDEMRGLLNSLSLYSAILLHGIFEPWCEVVLRNVPTGVKVAWEFWGGEIYGRRDLSHQLMAPFTRFVNTIHSVFRGNSSIEKWELPVDLYQKIDYCLTAQQEEFLFASNYILSDRIKHIWYTYYSIEKTVGVLIDKQCFGNKLWFCHNATVESNALDALYRFIFFKKFRNRIRNVSVIMPLSYGNPWIKNLMMKFCPWIFRHDFMPLTSFMKREEYNALMLSCSAMILPSYRPAGQGNIITALWLGMRVYLSEKSISYVYFKRIGVSIYSFESDFPKFGCTRISDEEMKENRLVLYKTFGQDSIDKAVASVVSALS